MDRINGNHIRSLAWLVENHDVFEVMIGFEPSDSRIVVAVTDKGIFTISQYGTVWNEQEAVIYEQ